MDLKGRTVLLVDDLEDLRKLMARTFKSKGCKVFEAGDGDEAFKIAEVEPIDLVISDIKMPICDGVELTKKLRNHDNKLPPIILISGESQYNKPAMIAAGATAFFSKPFNVQELLDYIATIA